MTQSFRSCPLISGCCKQKTTKTTKTFTFKIKIFTFIITQIQVIMAQGSACVVWHKDAAGIVHVLMGIESRYLTDYMDELEFRALNEHLRGDMDAGKKPGAISARTEELYLHATPGCYHRDAQNRKIFNPRIPLAEFQKIPVAHCLLEEDSKPIFERRAKALQVLIGRRVQYDTPVVDSGNYTVNFRIVVDPTTLPTLRSLEMTTHGFTLRASPHVAMSSFGILKGRKNGVETFEDAMLRELAEESGTQGVGVVLTPIGNRGPNHFFALELTAGQKETWQRHIASRLTRNSGELFNLGWVPCFDAGMNVIRPHVQAHPSIAMNGVSSTALELFGDACFSGMIPSCMPSAAARAARAAASRAAPAAAAAPAAPAAASRAAPAAARAGPFHAPSPHSQYDYQHGPPRSQHGPPRSQHGPPRSQHGPPRSQHGPPRSQHDHPSRDDRFSHPHSQHRGVNKPHHRRGGKTRKTNKKTFKRRK
jgi:hypothetical protein